jgi:hypothetical protein
VSKPFAADQVATEEAILRLILDRGGSPDADLIREIIATALKLVEEKASRGDLKIINSALKEMRYAFKVFAPYRHVRKVTIFGSSRIGGETPEYRQARAFAREVSELGFMIITGAGDGIMKAGQEGAGRDRSFGVNIRLPFEQRPNPIIQGDEKLIQFKYFFTRKLVFAKETDAIALFPGGFGTLDEAFEILTLAQTGKGQLLPIVFVDAPGGGYWREWEGFVRRQMLDRGMITPQDTALFRITDRVEEAVEEVAGFYRNYHSSRYVQDGRLVIRHLSPIPDGALARLNAEFADIVVDGQIERNGPHPDEANEPELADLPRLVLRFNRRDFGRLRRLIDALNTAAAELAAGPPRPVARRDGDHLSHA